MLTEHKYAKSDVQLGEGSDIFNCCKKTPDDPNCTECCYDTWKDELKTVKQQYAEKEEQVYQLEKKLGFITERRNRFKNWLNELDKAEDLARKICGQLDIIAVQSDKIWYNSCQAVHAIEILFCMVRDFYMQVDYLKTRYEDLQNCISRNTDPSLVKDSGILKCLKEYYDKLDAIIKTRDEIIKAILEAIKISNLIRNNISTRDCPDKNCPPKEGGTPYDPCKESNGCDCKNDGPSYYGFKTIICEWYCAFECDDDCKPGDDPCKDQTPQSKPAPVNECDPCADEECDLEPQFGFPICKNTYKCCIKKRYEFDEQYVRTLSEELVEARKKKEALKACKDSLDQAILVVDPKSRC